MDILQEFTAAAEYSSWIFFIGIGLPLALIRQVACQREKEL